MLANDSKPPGGLPGPGHSQRKHRTSKSSWHDSFGRPSLLGHRLFKMESRTGEIWIRLISFFVADTDADKNACKIIFCSRCRDSGGLFSSPSAKGMASFQPAVRGTKGIICKMWDDVESQMTGKNKFSRMFLIISLLVGVGGWGAQGAWGGLYGAWI